MDVRLQHLSPKKNYAGSRYKYRHKKRRICTDDLKHTLKHEPFYYDHRRWYDAPYEEPFYDTEQPPLLEFTPEETKSKKFQMLKDFLINYDRPNVAKSITPRQVRLYVATIGRLESLGLPVPDVEDAGIAGANLANGPKARETPIVIDTGCSFSLTPFKDDFVGMLETADHCHVTGLADSLAIEGQGTVEWKIRDVFGNVAIVRTRAYHVPGARIRLLSTQTYFQENKSGSMHQDHMKIVIHTPEGDELQFPYTPHSNLPLMYLDYCAAQTSVGIDPVALEAAIDSPEFNKTLNLLHRNNFNLTGPQKELLLWHTRLGHAGFRWIQALMRKRKQLVGEVAEPPVIPSGFETISKCDAPECAACQLSKQHRRKPGTEVTRRLPNKEMVIRRDDLKPGQKVSCDQYISKTPGRLSTTYGKERPTQQYNGGTIFVDHASGYIFIRNQVSLGIGETLQSKNTFEQFADSVKVKIKSYHADRPAI